MPRPVVLKIENSVNPPHEISPSLKFSKFSKSLPKLDSSVNTNEMPTTKNMVRRLISMYEDQDFFKSNLVKAKSLPHISTVKTHSFDNLENGLNHAYQSEFDGRAATEGFNFQSVWDKFETPTSEVQKIKSIKKKENVDLKDIEKNARALLDDYERISDSVWKQNVISFLNSICLNTANATVNVSETYTAEEKVKTNAEEHQHTVKGITNFFERQNSTNLLLSTPENMFHKYFTGINENHNDETQSTSDSSSLSDSNNSQNMSHLQQTPLPSMKIVELKSYFESKKDPATEESEENSKEIIVVDPDEEEEETKKDALEIIDDLKNKIKGLENEVESISKEDVDKGSQINEALIQILIKLDDVFAPNDDVRAARKEGISYVQRCIRALRNKMRS